jgi:peptidoglycan/xylan/chitin deacetylase (PgdA/CDA1 family)
VVALAVLSTWMLAASGCNLLGFVAYAADEATPRKVEAMYDGLAEKDFAVVAMTDRMVEADFPGMVPKVIRDVSERLAQEPKVNASGYLPADRVMAHLYSHPNWVARPMSELAKELKVQRLVVIEITEYRLNEPGNSYTWAGVAAGTVQVYEADSQLPDDPVFDRMVQVQFPDETNTGENDMAGNVVGTKLVQRFVERTAWLFYRHEEAKDLKY